MNVPFRLVDVFASRPLAGNQLCVVPEPVDLEDATMQALAKEIGFSETTFVTESGGDRYSLRIFTPAAELPFAGHPTLGTAFVLVSEGRVSSPGTQVAAAGEIPVEVDLEAGTAWMTQLPAEFGPVFEDRGLMAHAIGLEGDDLVTELPVRTVSTGLPATIVPLRDVQTLRRAVRNAAAVADAVAASGGEDLYLFAVTEEGVTARMFDAELGVGEDPATGSAAGALGAYLAEYDLVGMPGSVLIRQGEQVGRPSELSVETAREDGAWRARVGGRRPRGRTGDVRALSPPAVAAVARRHRQGLPHPTSAFVDRTLTPALERPGGPPSHALRRTCLDGIGDTLVGFCPCAFASSS